MNKQNILVQTLALSLCLVLVVDAAALNLPANYDYDNIRDLYELLMRNDGYQAPAARFGHQMERKGGRSPTLRLRFGKRSDPYWAGVDRPVDTDGNTHSSS